MAQRMVLVDDIDQTESTDIETITFGLHGTLYEVDLNKKNQKKLEDALAPFVAVGRKASGSTKRSTKRSTNINLSEDRQWLRDNGFPETKNGGRLSTAAQSALNARKGN